MLIMGYDYLYHSIIEFELLSQSNTCGGKNNL